MKHNLNIRVVKSRSNGGVVTCRSVTVREKLLRFLFGSPQKLTVIIPGDTVDAIAINETEKEAERDEAV